jgi:hypothetical protein
VRKMPPAYRDLARQCFAFELREQPCSAGQVEVLERAQGKLRERLVRLVGPEGFLGLLDRALYLTKVEHPFLRPVEVEAFAGKPSAEAPLLRGLHESAQGRGAAEVQAALATLFGSLIWLLATFIGEDLAHRELARIWPKVSFDQASIDSGEAAQ